MSTKYRNESDERLEALLNEARATLEGIQEEVKVRTERKRLLLWNNLVEAVKAYCAIGSIEVLNDTYHPVTFLTPYELRDDEPGIIVLDLGL